MPRASSPMPALAGCLLIALSGAALAQRLDEPVWVESDARQLAASPAVEQAADSLLAQTLAGARPDRLISAINRVRADSTLAPAQRDAALLDYVERLRRLPPGSAPQAVLDWLARMPPLAVTGHEEGAHHPVPLFNVAGRARGLANEWAWRRGHDDLAGSNPLTLSALSAELGGLSSDNPRYRGIRAAVERLPAETLEALATHCAVQSDGCGAARADIELARGNVRWLSTWLASTTSQAVMPRLRRIRQTLPSSEARELMQAALEHPDKGVAAWAMSDLTAHLPKDETGRREWGSQLVSLLDDPDLGGVAALQLARMDGDDWLEAAARQTLTERGRRRLELLAELETAVPKIETESGAGP